MYNAKLCLNFTIYRYNHTLLESQVLADFFRINLETVPIQLSKVTTRIWSQYVICDFNLSDLYVRDIKIHCMKFNPFERKKFKCNMCNEKFKTGTELTEHNHIKHGPTK